MAGMTSGGNERRVRRTCVVSVTSAGDGLEHLVADAEMTPGNAGRYVTLCLRTMWAAALVCPPGPRCSACIAVHNADAADKPQHRRTGQRGVWAWLTARLRRPRTARSDVEALERPLDG